MTHAKIVHVLMTKMWFNHSQKFTVTNSDFRDIYFFLSGQSFFRAQCFSRVKAKRYEPKCSLHLFAYFLSLNEKGMGGKDVSL